MLSSASKKASDTAMGFFKDTTIENKDVSFLFYMTVMQILQIFVR